MFCFQFEIKEKERAEVEHPEDVLRAKEEKLQQLIKEFLPPEKPYVVGHFSLSSEVDM